MKLTSIKKLLSWNFIQKFSFSSKSSDILFKFKHNMDLHEHEVSCLKIPQEKLKKMEASDILHNRIASEFLAKSDQIELFYTNKTFDESKDFNTPFNSFIQIRLALEENQDLRNKFIRFRPESIRVGRLLEALDFTATFVSYFHSKNEPFNRSCTMITVCVDHLKFFSNLRGDKNIIINAYPTYSGNSSVEIRTDLFQENLQNEEKMVASALFLMAARDYKEYSKPFILPKLKFDEEIDKNKCLLRFDLGKLNQELRKKQVSSSLLKSPPSEEESLELHEIFLKNEENLRENIPVKYMQDTKKTKSMLMHNQDRNIHGKIFGGFMMKESIEFAWLVAYSYSNGDHPEFEAIDDFTFINSVDIGSIVDFEAMVTFTQGSLIHIKVEAIKYPKVLKEGEKERQKCTELHITLKCPVSILEPVYPATYEEAMIYLESKRRVKKLLEFSQY